MKTLVADDANCFPKLDRFMHALQDPSKPSKQPTKKRSHGASSRTDMVIVYPKHMKVLLAGVQRTLQAKHAHLGTPKNLTDCKKQLAFGYAASYAFGKGLRTKVLYLWSY